MTYNIYGITNCICEWIENNNIEPEILSFTLSFGVSKEYNYETPSLLVGVASKSDIENWKLKNDFIYYIWNQAEYTHYEIKARCIDNNFLFEKEKSREYFIEMLLKDKNEFREKIYNKTGYKIILYIHDLDNQDISSIILENFNISEIQSLKEKGLIPILIY